MQLAELKRFAPAAKHTMLSGLMQAWPQAEAAGMVTPARICHFLAQCFVESRGFTDVEEDLSYSAKRLVQVWPKRFPTIESAAPYAHNPEALANKVYGGRMGNTDPGDGWKFRGAPSSRSPVGRTIKPAARRSVSISRKIRTRSLIRRSGRGLRSGTGRRPAAIASPTRTISAA